MGLTTLGARIVGGDRLSTTKPYVRIASDSPQKLVVRNDLYPANPKRQTTRKALAAFGHITDTHIMDPTSPAHTVLSALRPGDSLKDRSTFFYRPQDSLSVHVLDAMIRRLNSMESGPITDRPFDFYISTGDSSDRRATNEVIAFIDTLNGEKTSAFALPGNTASMQSPIELPESIARFVWQPVPPKVKTGSRVWQDKYGFPNTAHLLSSASKPVSTEGANVPWYSGFGNHDAMIPQSSKDFGTPNETYYSFLAVGDKFPLEIPSGIEFSSFMESLENPSPAKLTSIVSSMPGFNVKPSTNRRAMSKTEFMSAHLINSGPQGPPGHGFTTDNLRTGETYYTFPLADGILGIMLDTTDTTGGGQGSVSRKQADWLESALNEVSAVRYDLQGRIINSNVENRLVVLFSHHPSYTFAQPKTQGLDPGSIISGQAMLDLLGRYPNLILWVSGHMHRNKVWPRHSVLGNHGFWELNTASHIDYPQQARTVEILDNDDGSLSIFGVMVNHSEPRTIRYSGSFNPADLAVFSSELALNSPASNTAARIGTDNDQNVELLLSKPF
ncbi:TIGR03767 family metallophosphoesterase [Arthrobacter psychrochitiniphilus]|nr:TIGR03767 family metallophosphoesterase [Arthrobacter psychrochitiniphilus]NYG18035.1 metallophosphoesterase (TIGR03767 family) [Arthrobacter psychrochitiniphilus]